MSPVVFPPVFTAARGIALLATVWLVVACAPPEEDGPTSELVATNDRGVALMGRYEYAEAETVFADVVTRAPEWLDARVNLAIATLNRQNEGDEQLALDILAEVTAADPTHLRALYTSAILKLYLGDAPSAAALLRRVVASDPEDAYAAYFLGQALLQQGDYGQAAEWLVKAATLDPYLRSAYWAGSQALRRVGRDEEAGQLLADYQRFETNPAARLAGFSYTRMGPKAAALAANPVTPPEVAKPEGPLFAQRRSITDSSAADLTVTSADLDGDGSQELVLTGDQVPVVLAYREQSFSPTADHPFASSGSLGSPLWGDIDDDGLLDVVLCREAGVFIRHQAAPGVWADALTLGDDPCTGGALFDADHDGDLDVFTVGADGSELFSNNRDGSFRRLAEDMGLRGGDGRQVLVADLDGDRDLDIVVLNRTPPHDVWRNDRTWRYGPFAALDDFKATSLAAAAVVDADADGRPELYGLTNDGGIERWQRDGVAWSRESVVGASEGAPRALDVADFDGDGRPEILRALASGFSVIDPRSGKVLVEHAAANLHTAAAVALEPASGPAVVAATGDGLALWPPGPGRHAFIALAPTGRSEADQMRSNASGIGTLVKVRAAGRWSVLLAMDAHSGPGQSLQPLSVGLGGHHQADFIAVEWSDGVSQTELDLAAGQRHVIVETQRQLASCPVFFVWDGDKYRFVSDVLGGGALGFLDTPGSYVPARPVESYLLAGDVLAARDGHYHIKLTEPMEENAYLDAARLTVYDLPPQWSMALDERMSVAGPPATGRPIFYRHSQSPASVTADDGADVTALATELDRRAPSPGALDKRFIGLLADEQTLTLEFEAPLPAEGAVLLADGWIEYPYSQTVFAAWQAGLRYRPVTLAARAGDGDWQPVAVEFGYPAGMPRTMALPLDNLPAGTHALRLSSNMEIYWDRLRVVREEPLAVAATALRPAAARVARTGFPKRTTGSQRLPHYDYHDRSTFWDAKVPRGFYTSLGDADELVMDIDGALAIIGSGEEIHLQFAAVEPPPANHRRYFAVTFHGWAKDMDLYTLDGETVGPLPSPDALDEELAARRDRLHARYNLRYQEGL